MSKHLEDAWEDWLIAVGALHDGRSTKREDINALFDAVGAIMHHLEAQEADEGPVEPQNGDYGVPVVSTEVLRNTPNEYVIINVQDELRTEGVADVYDGEQVRRILCTILETDGVNLQSRRGAQLIGADADLVRTILGGGK